MPPLTNSVWSCFSAVDAPSRYDDIFGFRYCYDSNVQSHTRIRVGDVLVIRDHERIYGFGAVERISTRAGTKPMLRCPFCGRAKVSERRVALPRYRCTACTEEFPEPTRIDEPVTVYEAEYGRNWYPFLSRVPVDALETLYLNRDRQNAIRRLDPLASAVMLRGHCGVEGTLFLEVAGQPADIQGGWSEALVRTRLGQQRFLADLLDRYGSSCAITGPQPEAVLDAAHLYPFAAAPVHESGGGLLLRADLHRLFGRFLLAFEPDTLRTRVEPTLRGRFPALGAYDDVPLTLAPGLEPREDLVERHFLESLERWRVAT